MFIFTEDKSKMADKTLNVQILTRNDTAANWSSTNPVLGKAEAAYETDSSLLTSVNNY